MKLRFKVDQAELFRRGIDCPKSIITVDVNPADVPPDVRELIALRMDGIDIKTVEVEIVDEKPDYSRGDLIVALGTTLDDLIAAVKKEHSELEAIISEHDKELDRLSAEARTFEEARKQRPPVTLKPPYKMPN